MPVIPIQVQALVGRQAQIDNTILTIGCKGDGDKIGDGVELAAEVRSLKNTG